MSQNYERGEIAVHIGILKTDAVRPEWVGEFGEYPDMFVRLVGEANPETTFSTWDVEEGVHPTQDDIDSVDGFIITGSKAQPTMTSNGFEILRVSSRNYTPSEKRWWALFWPPGDCAGTGWLVSKSDKGWGVGINIYNLGGAPFEGGESGELKLIASTRQGMSYRRSTKRRHQRAL